MTTETRCPECGGWAQRWRDGRSMFCAHEFHTTPEQCACTHAAHTIPCPAIVQGKQGLHVCGCTGPASPTETRCAECGHPKALHGYEQCEECACDGFRPARAVSPAPGGPSDEALRHVAEMERWRDGRTTETDREIIRRWAAFASVLADDVRDLTAGVASLRAIRDAAGVYLAALDADREAKMPSWDLVWRRHRAEESLRAALASAPAETAGWTEKNPAEPKQARRELHDLSSLPSVSDHAD